jgi:hypothetical protein
MAKSFESTRKAKKSVIVDPTFITATLADMVHLQVGYTERGALEPRISSKKGKVKRAGLHEDAYVLSKKDIRTPIEDGGVVDIDDTYRDFIRVICINQQIRKQKNTKHCFIVDASHLELGETSLINDKFESHPWSLKRDGKPLPVLQLITNSLDLQFAKDALQADYGLILPKSELSIMREEQGV